MSEGAFPYVSNNYSSVTLSVTANSPEDIEEKRSGFGGIESMSMTCRMTPGEAMRLAGKLISEARKVEDYE